MPHSKLKLPWKHHQEHSERWSDLIPAEKTKITPPHYIYKETLSAMKSTGGASSSPMYLIIFLLMQGLTRSSVNTYIYSIIFILEQLVH